MHYLIRFALIFTVTAVSGTSYSQTILADSYVAMNAEQQDSSPLADVNANGLDTAVATPLNTTVPPGSSKDDFKEPWLTTNKAHEYLGVATLLTSMATALTAPSSCETNCANKPAPTHGVHQTLGRTTGALALATVATGLLFHWKDMHLFADGLSDPDTQHWLLAGSGALIMAQAISKAPAKSHSAQAEAGAVIMLIGVKMAW